MTQGGNEGMWLRWEVVMKGTGDERWWRGVVKGGGDDGKWWWRGVVTKGSDNEGEFRGRDWVCLCVCVVVGCFGICACRSHWNGCMMLQGLCFGEEAGARNLVFFRVKWLQPAMKSTSSVRRLRLRAFLSRIVPPMCFATSGCSCVRSSMRFLKLWLQIALEWLHDVAWALC